MPCSVERVALVMINRPDARNEELLARHRSTFGDRAYMALSLRRRPGDRCTKRARCDRFRNDPLPLAPDDVRLHREILGQSEPVDDRGSVLVPLLDPLPELTVILAGEGSTVFLALVLEDREDLASKLVFRQGHEDVGFRHTPLLPRAAIVPDIRLLA